MTCTQGARIAPYVDGELGADEAEAFALHLASCAACRAQLHDALQLVAVEARAAGAGERLAAPTAADEDAPGSEGVAPGRLADVVPITRRRRTPIIIVGAVLAVAAVAVAVLAWPRSQPPQIALATAPTRALEGRIAYAPADRHRPYAIVRGAATAEQIPLDALAGLERRGDPHGVAAGYLLLGDPARAETYLAKATGPDAAADRALVELTAGRAEAALIALDRVLASAPRHPQALWNRALALRDLGLPRMAVQAFEAVAALGEPGWADEARQRARVLAADTDLREQRSQRLIAGGTRLATAPDGIAPELARQIPGSARMFFYEGVRGAATADAVRALAPLAATLDALAGDHALADHLAQIARADFRIRGPLAARYARLVAGDATEDATLLADLRAARQDDILIGALMLFSPDGSSVPAAQLPELRRLTDATGQRWFQLLEIEQRARAALAADQPAAAELAILPALAACADPRLDMWCTRLQLVLGQSYLASQRLSDARRVLADGAARARRSGQWLLEQLFLPERASLALLEDDASATTLPLARAYLGELARRDARCATEVWTHEVLAQAEANQLDPAAARAELAMADAITAKCPDAKAIVPSVFVKAQIATDDQVAGVRAEIARLRQDPATPPSLQVVLDQTEGVLLIERDRAAAVALLEHAIAASRTLDVGDAHRARAYAYAALTLEAGRGHDWARVWQLLGDELGSRPDRCGLGIAVEARRSVVVARSADGAFTGSYTERRSRADADATELVPAGLRDHLRGCAEVDVLARPPIQGSPELLRDVAWSYRAGPGVAAPPGRGPRVVVSDPDPPAALGLPRLLPWRSQAPADVTLEGASATPASALAAFADASFIVINAHGTVNAAVSDASILMMSPDAGGAYALTAAEIRAHALRGHPVVILAACHAGATAPYRHEPWGLPAAFLAAGARAVIASPDVIADAEAGAFFDDVRARIEHGSSPALALHEARRAWLAGHPDASWTRSLMVFR
jgi:hypothetical protein